MRAAGGLEVRAREPGLELVQSDAGVEDGVALQVVGVDPLVLVDLVLDAGGREGWLREGVCGEVKVVDGPYPSPSLSGTDGLGCLRGRRCLWRAIGAVEVEHTATALHSCLRVAPGAQVSRVVPLIRMVQGAPCPNGCHLVPLIRVPLIRCARIVVEGICCMARRRTARKRHARKRVAKRGRVGRLGRRVGRRMRMDGDTRGYEGVLDFARAAASGVGRKRGSDWINGQLKKVRRRNVAIQELRKRLREKSGGTGASQQYHKQKFSFGRGTSRLAAVRRLDKLQFNTIELQWRAVNPFSDPESSIMVYNQRDPAAANPRISRLPLYIFDITQRDHPSGATGILGQSVAHRLQFNNTTNAVAWATYAAEDAFSGQSTSNFFMQAVKAPELMGEQATSTSQLFKVQDVSILRGCKLDLMLRGIRTRPTMYKIQFVQFLDDQFAPTYIPTAGSLQEKEHTRFWMDFIKPCLVNPLSYNSKDVSLNKKMRVIKSYYAKFNPDESSNLDTRPHMRRFSVNFNMNKLCDYRDLTSDVPTAAADEYQVNDGVDMVDGNIDGSVRSHIAEPTKRIYVIISAQVYDRADSATTSTVAPFGTSTDQRALFPTMDVAIHTWHTQRQLGSNGPT